VDIMELLTALILCNSVTPLERSTAQEDVWEEENVLATSANVILDLLELIVL